MLFNVVAIAIELMIFLVALFAGLFGRVVLRRPWTVYAKSKHLTHERHAVGWRGSRALHRRHGARACVRPRARARAGGPAMTG